MYVNRLIKKISKFAIKYKKTVDLLYKLIKIMLCEELEPYWLIWIHTVPLMKELTFRLLLDNFFIHPTRIWMMETYSIKLSNFVTC